MPEQQKLYIIRKEYDGFGGAENVSKRYNDHFSVHYDTDLIYAGTNLGDCRFNGNKGPGWWRSLSFSNSVNHFLRKRNDSITFSMTRGIPGHVFRVGDGVHNRWLAYSNTGFLKRFINPNHIITPKLERYSIEHSGWIVPNSNMVAQEISAEYPQCTQKIKVIHNGFDPNRFQFADEAKRAALKEEIGTMPNVLQLLFCANGWGRKGLEYTLELVSRINQESRCYLWVLGRGNQRHFTAQCNDLGITNYVTFLGSQQNVTKWYQMADLFVLPTAYDPFSNSCLEALACGCPVITTNSNGASECINSHNGLVVHSPKKVFSAPAVDWSLKARYLDRSEVSQSVSELTSENEIKAYLKLLKS